MGAPTGLRPRGALKRARTEELNPLLAKRSAAIFLPADGNNAAVNWRGYGMSRWQLDDKATSLGASCERGAMTGLWPDAEIAAMQQISSAPRFSGHCGGGVDPT
jgi:hypothetical protein